MWCVSTRARQVKGKQAVMTMQQAVPQRDAVHAERLLFAGGPRLGWVFRDRRQLVTPYTEPGPD